MAWTAIAGLVAFVALFLFLLALRLDVARLEARVDDAEVAV
jgi:hypothetical protein